MKPPPQISDSEWKVMEALWERSPLTLAELADSVGAAAGWKDKTIHTFLSRLEEKGAVTKKRDGRRHLYSAAVSREDCVRQISESLAGRLFRGAESAFLLKMVEAADLDPAELEELQAILDGKRKGGRR